MKEIKLTQNKTTLVDNEDFEKVNRYKWSANYIHKHWYAIRKTRKSKGKRTVQLMHRLITDCPEGLKIDHINHDGLDKPLEEKK